MLVDFGRLGDHNGKCRPRNAGFIAVMADKLPFKTLVGSKGVDSAPNTVITMLKDRNEPGGPLFPIPVLRNCSV